MRNLEGKVVAITGGGGEIGAAVARRLVEAGAAVLLVDRDAEALRNVSDGIASDAVAAVVADVASAEGTQTWIDAALTRFGRIDLLHNNAGIEGRIAPIVDLEAADLDRVLAVNVRGAFLALQAALRVMRRQGDGGAIVNSASFGGIRGLRNLAPYVMSKHAVVGLTRTAAIEGARFGIRVNAVAPGPVRTRMMSSIERGQSPEDPDAARDRTLATIPAGRYGEPEDVAAVVAWLLCDESSYVNGAVVPVDGARSA